MTVVETSIAELRAALEAGRDTSLGLVRAYLDRIARYDCAGPCLNAVPVLNPEAEADARAPVADADFFGGGGGRGGPVVP